MQDEPEVTPEPSLSHRDDDIDALRDDLVQWVSYYASFDSTESRRVQELHRAAKEARDQLDALVDTAYASFPDVMAEELGDAIRTRGDALISDDPIGGLRIVRQKAERINRMRELVLSLRKRR